MGKAKREQTVRKADMILIFAAAVLAILGSIYFMSNPKNEKGSIVGIYRNGELQQEISLEQNQEIIVRGTFTNKILIEEGKVSVIESDCPGNDCVLSGEIHELGRSIICLPNRVEIRIEGESEVDFVVR